MKLAILLLCHKNAEQINLFLQTMKHSDIDFYIHVDKKSHITNQIAKRPDIHILSDSLRVDVQWGGISMIQATLNMLQEAYCSKKFDYYWLCSGQDFPIKSASQIIDYFTDHYGNNFVSVWDKSTCQKRGLYKRVNLYYPQFLFGRTLLKRILKRAYVELTGGYFNTYPLFKRKNEFNKQMFYFGPQWIAVTDEFVKWALTFLYKNTWYSKGYEHCVIPDESFFQTLFMNSPFKETKHNFLHYIDWSPKKGKPRNSPNTLTINDFEALKVSHYLMARKFDMDVDKDIILKLYNGL